MSFIKTCKDNHFIGIQNIFNKKSEPFNNGSDFFQGDNPNC